MFRFLVVFVGLVAVSYIAMVALIPSVRIVISSAPGQGAAQRLSSEAALTLGAKRPPESPQEWRTDL
jgi:hypothetical protein